jgi:hypothetical protein
MVAFSHHIKHDTSNNSILHCIKLLTAVSLGFLYKEFKNVTNKEPPWKTLLPHTIMAAQQFKKFLAF